MIVQKTKVIPEGYVDLGLPSGLLWAKCNDGATTETDYGKFFQWGDVEGELVEGTTTTRVYNWSTAPFDGGNSSYDADSFAAVSGDVCPNRVLASQYDAAYQATNGVAHMPTQDDCRELIANTTVSWETNFNGSGVNGRKFTSKTDASKYIFIPASGYTSYGSVYGRGSDGYVWSSSLNYRNTWFLYFGSSSVGVNYGSRYYGFAVRGVVSTK